MCTETVNARDLHAEAAAAGFARNFIGLTSARELRVALESANEADESWPSPAWLREASPAAMAGVTTGWETWEDDAPEGALVLLSGSEQRVACGDRWFLFPK